MAERIMADITSPEGPPAGVTVEDQPERENQVENHTEQPREVEQREDAPIFQDPTFAATERNRLLAEEIESLFNQRFPGEEGRERYNQLPPQEQMRIANEIQRQAQRGLQARPDVGAMNLGGRETRPLRQGEEYFRVRTASGISTDIPLPRSPEGKIDRMREILGRMEASKEADGGEVNRRLYQEISLVISTLREREDEADRKLGEDMYNELDARVTFNATYLQFQKADGAQAVASTLQTLRAAHINTLFHDIPGVMQAFAEFERRAEEILKADVDKVEQIKKEIANSPTVVEATKIPPDASEHDDGRPREPMAPIIVAERLWEVTGRRVIHERLEGTDPAKGFEEQLKSGDVRFMWDIAGGGNFMMRRILRAKEGFRTYTKLYKPQLQLLDEVDFKATDFITSLPGTVEGAYKRELKNKFLSGGITDEAIRQEFDSFYNEFLTRGFREDDGKINKNTIGEEEIAREKALEEVIAKAAYEMTQEIFPNLKKEPKINKETNEKDDREYRGDWFTTRVKKDGEWVEEKHLLDAPDTEQATPQAAPQTITQIRWDKIDFGILGENPLLVWGLYGISMPDSFRVALLSEKPDTYLRKPTYDGLKALNDTLVYQGNSWHETKAKLFENLITFQRKDQRKALGVMNISYEDAEKTITQAVNDNFITKEEREKVERALIKTSWLSFLGKYQIIFHIFNPFILLYVSILDAIKKGNSSK